MLIEDAYLKFLEKVNKNYTNDSMVADKGRFIYLYNEAQNKFVEWILEKRNEDEIRDIAMLLIYDKRLKMTKQVLNHQDFSLPDDYFGYSNVQVYASKGLQKDRKLLLFEIKQENKEEFLHDKFNEPSFEFEETFYSFGGGDIKIYKKDFDISKVFLTYYRQPRQVDIEGYVKADGSLSASIHPEFDDKLVDRILTICTKDFNMNIENLQKVNFDRERVVSRA